DTGISCPAPKEPELPPEFAVLRSPAEASVPVSRQAKRTRSGLHQSAPKPARSSILRSGIASWPDCERHGRSSPEGCHHASPSSGAEKAPEKLPGSPLLHPEYSVQVSGDSAEAGYGIVQRGRR